MLPHHGVATWLPVMNSKSPPPWSPEMAITYPLRHYCKDVILWSVGCDLNPAQQGPTAVLQLAGEARTIADEINITELMNGVTADWGDGLGAVHHAGLLLLLRRLGERFGELETETAVRVMLEFFNYRRQRQSNIDQAITQFDILHVRAVDNASLGMSPSVLAYMLLQALGIGPHRWPMLFMNWGGTFPINDQLFRQLKSNIRQHGHMVENHPTGMMAITQRNGSFPTYMTPTPRMRTTPRTRR